jgi:hypothetical protein
VGKVHRRICFLRFEGRSAEAQSVNDQEFAAAVAEARKDSNSDAEADVLLRSIEVEDEERVADAIAFAEVLVPMLSERQRVASPASARAADHPRQRRAALEPAGESRGIADFIDDMLAQDRAGSH